MMMKMMMIIIIIIIIIMFLCSLLFSETLNLRGSVNVTDHISRLQNLRISQSC